MKLFVLYTVLVAMSDPDDVLPLGKDVVVSSDSDVTKSDIT